MNYNFIAPYYHFLSSLFFLNRQHLAHFTVLNYINENDRILWIGGGAGKFLPELDKLDKKLTIDYIDFSSKMIELAQEQSYSNLTINFITADILDYQLVEKYDVVMTTFLFDHFSQQIAETLFYKISDKLKNNGIWFYVDFIQNQTTWQKSITRLMILFFKIIAGLNVSSLPKMNLLFNRTYEINTRKLFFRTYIESIVYRKKV
ncbi:class I SAM-dependent methyltransferase [Chishuiella sp.]|uniref:class I SAM-dependent methyltransferase n=1 Tax=Chishuiella sp. TaxID=1969467 RepID=UPI0028AB41BA|nr:class I SAM-dependent methyltransferase [Chishuiella sp.]